MLAQHYKVKATAEDRQRGRPGTPVYASAETDELVGFVNFVSDIDVCIYLFGQGDLTIPCVVLAEEVKTTEWQHRLHDIVKSDPEMHRFWSQVFNAFDGDF